MKSKRLGKIVFHKQVDILPWPIYLGHQIQLEECQVKDLVKLRLFISPTCPKCPAAKQVVERIRETRMDVNIEIVDVANPENQITALMLQIASTPAIVVEDRTIFVGEVPSLEELNRKLDEHMEKFGR